MDEHDNRAGLKDLDTQELDTLCRRLVHVTRDELDTGANSIHITGSFARNDATLGESDLDIRIVTTGYVSTTNLSNLTTRIESETDPEYTPTGCETLDIHATPFELLQSEPSIEIWSRQDQ